MMPSTTPPLGGLSHKTPPAPPSGVLIDKAPTAPSLVTLADKIPPAPLDEIPPSPPFGTLIDKTTPAPPLGTLIHKTPPAPSLGAHADETPPPLGTLVDETPCLYTLHSGQQCSTPNTSKIRPLTRDPVSPFVTETSSGTLSPLTKTWAETPSGTLSPLTKTQVETSSGALSPLTKTQAETPGDVATKHCYYGVYVPCSLDETDSSMLAESHVFTDKIEALKFMKKSNKESRFKCFTDHSDAVNFAMGINSSFMQTPQQKIPEPRRDTASPGSPGVSEALPLKAPKTQELNTLRKAIESNKLDVVEATIWENPRYLISSGDTPTIVQEGFRYNVFHVAARSNKHEILSLLISTLEDPAFYKLLYIHDTDVATERRIDFLLDMYLNMTDRPDKGNGDTPLHFSCKFGHTESVNILTSHPKTDKNRKNKHGQRPIDVIGERVSCSEEVRKTIQSMLEETYYVPLYRSDDETRQAMIGFPWSPDAKSDQLQPSFNSTDSSFVVKAYAGPMTPKKAEEFHRRWTTPSQSSLVKKECHRIRCTDTSKGFERIGRNVAHNMNVPWVEYWNFLGCSTDLTSVSGLAKLEAHLSNMCHGCTSTNTPKNSTRLHSPNTPRLRSTNTSTLCSPNALGSPNISIRSDGIMSSLANDFANLRLNTTQECVDYTSEGDHFEKGDTRINETVDNDSSHSNHSDEENDYDDYSKHTFKSEPIVYPSIFGIFGKMVDATKYVAGFILGTSSAEQYHDQVQTAEHPAIREVYYINGAIPSKIDVDVCRAISRDNIDPVHHPYTTRWHDIVSSFSDQEKKSWSSPAISRSRQDTASNMSPQVFSYQVSPNTSPDRLNNVKKLGDLQRQLFTSGKD